MTAFIFGKRRGRPWDPRRTVLMVSGAVATLLVSTMAAQVLERYQPSWRMVLGGGLTLLVVLALAVARYEAAVGLGALLLGVVAIEPAPPDLVFAVVMAVALATRRFDLGRAPISILGICAIFFLLNLVSVVDAKDEGRAAVYLSITLYLLLFGLWLTGYVTSERRARGLVRFYLAGAVPAALATSVALFVRFPHSDALLSGDGLRGKGLFKDPNVFAPFLVVIALILMEEILRPNLLRLRTSGKVLMLIVLMVGIFLSYSRGAWVNFTAAVIIMLVVLAVRPGGGRRAAVLIGILCVGGVAIFGVLSLTGSLDFLQERAKGQYYDTERFAAQRRGIRFGEEHLFGIGPGQFEVLAPVPSHNLYVRSLAEQGFLGLAAMTSLVLITLLFAARNAIHGSSTYGIGSAALLGIWVGLVFESFVIDTLHWRHLWLVAALIWIGTWRGRTAEGRGTRLAAPTAPVPIA